MSSGTTAKPKPTSLSSSKSGAPTSSSYRKRPNRRGPMLTRAFVRTLESGEFDLAMFVVNFVDRHTYNFEGKVIPVARKHNAGIVAMKVRGGSASGYERKDQRAKLGGSGLW